MTRMDSQRREPLDNQRAPSEPTPRQSRVGLLLFFFVTIPLAAAPVLAGVAQRLVDGWQPQGDDAEIAWLTHDVFSSHSPLVGLPSTIGGPGTSRAHHWGPLLFWVLALPQKLASENPVGLQAGLLLLELAAIAGVAVFTYRRLGRLGTLTILVLLGVVTWSLGRQILSSIWNPDIALLPLVGVFVLVWSFADGDRLALPFLAFGASFVVQCNILYTPLVAALLVWATVGFVLTHRELRRNGTAPSSVAVRRTLIVSGAVLLFCWSAPIIQQLTNRPGNVELVLRNGTGESGQHVGVTRTLSVLAHTIGMPPLWSHPDDVSKFSSSPSIVTTLTALGIAFAVVGGLVWAWRRELALRSLLGTAVVGLMGLAVIVWRLPWGFWGFGIAPYRLRSAWIAGMFVWFAFVVLVARSLARHLAQSAEPRSYARVVRASAVVLSMMLVVIAVLGAQGDTPQTLRDADSSDVVTRLLEAARRELPKPGPFLAVHTIFGIGSGVFWALERDGYDIRITDASDPFDAPYIASGHGPGHRKLRRLTLVDSPTLSPPSAGQKLIASTTLKKGTAAQRRRLAQSRAKVCRQLEANPPGITDQGRRILRQHAAAPDDGDADVAALARYSDGASPCELIDDALRLVNERHAITLRYQQRVGLFELYLGESATKDHTYALYVGPP